MSRPRIKNLALIVASALAGGALTVSIQAFADKEAPLAPLPLNELRTFAEVFGRIKQDYVEPVNDKKLINDAIKGMITGLDPHSDYMDADSFKELRETTQGEFGGLGIEIGAEDGLIKVISPIDDTPAYRAGVKSGDLIVKIDDTPVRGLTPNDAVKRMKGKPGTKVTLTLLRKNEAKPLVVTITRAIIRYRSVKSGLVEPGYGYVRISQFMDPTTANMAAAITSLYRQNKAPLKGLVLDLRGNPGGVLTGAVGVSAAFLPKDTLVVYTEGRAADSKMKLFANAGNYSAPNQPDPLAKLPPEVRKVPLVVLVNSGSASASEIVAGALQDNKRALILGTQTFGKGSVQSILPLGTAGGIKLTTARYFTPSGHSIQAKGITPDVVVENGVLTTGEQALRIREADLEHHLSNPNGEDKTEPRPAKKVAPPAPAPASVPAPAGNGSKATPDDDPQSGAIPNPKNDYQLSQAITTLKVQQLMLKKAN
ncbi:S41 family peptidase [Paludibacterium paludis]|uniref:Peptidase S41 n=1 Tax=Paludibacterium paludis TaxID=1225769 RepID=A0A918NWG6_9NEIS|nr:S41 family peptidase [Paludibacterium paludis]GGY02428.1 peptidase S41 [Paludibacterium paludis]